MSVYSFIICEQDPKETFKLALETFWFLGMFP